MRRNRTHGRTPRSFVEVGPEVTLKRFVTPEGKAHEFAFYEAVPWACPEVVAHDAFTITMRTCEVAWGLPEWRPVQRLHQLLTRVHQAGVAHRDVHVKNVVRGPEGQPLLIDWECAAFVQSDLSYDLYGPEASGVPVPDIHVRLDVTPAWWGSPERHSIRNQWGT